MRQSIGKALHSGLDIVEALSRRGEPLTHGELKEQVDISPASFSRFLKILNERGYVKKEKDGRYTLGWRIMSIGGAALNRMPFRELVNPHLERIAKETLETAEAAIFENGHFVFVGRVESPQPVVLRAPVGQSFAVSDSNAIGILGMVASGKTIRDTVIDAEKIAGTGYAERYQPANEAVRIVKVIRDAAGVVGCVVAAAPAYRMNDEKREVCRKVLGREAFEISKALGWRGRSAEELVIR